MNIRILDKSPWPKGDIYDTGIRIQGDTIEIWDRYHGIKDTDPLLIEEVVRDLGHEAIHYALVQAVGWFASAGFDQLVLYDGQWDRKRLSLLRGWGLG